MSDPLSPAMFHILLALVDSQRHGYGIMQEIDQFTAGKLRVGPGTLYRSLKQLLAMGLIQESEAQGTAAPHDEQRRYYRITEAGKRTLRAELQQLEILLKTAQAKGIMDRQTRRVVEG